MNTKANSWMLQLMPQEITHQTLPSLREAKTVISQATKVEQGQTVDPVSGLTARHRKADRIITLYEQGYDIEAIAQMLFSTVSYVRNRLIHAGKMEKAKWRGGRKPLRIDQLSPEGACIATFDSVAAASRALQIEKENIRVVCHGKRSMAGGYKFRWHVEESRADLTAAR